MASTVRKLDPALKGGKKMHIEILRVTPTMAEQWLNFNKNNRKLREGVAEKYAEDMAQDRWTECPEPISFYDDGDLADGQHRLFAIVLSGKTIEFPVAHNLSRAAGLNLNMGLMRSLVDNARISGTDPDLSNQLLGLARAIELGKPSSNNIPLSNAQRLEMVDKHREAAKWVISHGPRGRGLNNAMMGAALARAWYYETDLDRLKLFCDVFSSGHVHDAEQDSAAVTLRNYFLQKSALGGTALWTDTFFKAQNAIHYFMEGKRLTVIKTVKDEAYPLPKGKRKKAA